MFTSYTNNVFSFVFLVKQVSLSCVYLIYLHALFRRIIVTNISNLRCFRQGIEMTSDRIFDTSDKWRYFHCRDVRITLL